MAKDLKSLAIFNKSYRAISFYSLRATLFIWIGKLKSSQFHGEIGPKQFTLKNDKMVGRGSHYLGNNFKPIFLSAPILSYAYRLQALFWLKRSGHEHLFQACWHFLYNILLIFKAQMKPNQWYRIFVYAYGLRQPQLLNLPIVFVRTLKHRGFNFHATFITNSFKNLTWYTENQR